MESFPAVVLDLEGRFCSLPQGLAQVGHVDVMQRWLSHWPEVIWMPSWMNFNKERFDLKFTIETYARFLLNLYPGPQLCSFPISYPPAYFFPCSFFSLWVSLFSHHLLKVLRSFWKLLLNKSNEEMENCCYTQVRKWLEILTESNKYTCFTITTHHTSKPQLANVTPTFEK